MSKDVTQVQSPAAPESEQHTASFDEHMTWQARWFLIRTIPFLYAASLLSGIIGCWLTKDPRYLSLASPTIFALPTIRYLVPMDERRYQLELKKIEMKTQARKEKQRNKANKKL